MSDALQINRIRSQPTSVHNCPPEIVNAVRFVAIEKKDLSNKCMHMLDTLRHKRTDVPVVMALSFLVIFCATLLDPPIPGLIFSSLQPELSKLFNCILNQNSC